MKAFVNAVASVLLVALLPGCRSAGGAFLGAVVGSSIVTAAVLSSRPPPPARVEYVPAPTPGYVWQPGYWALEDNQWVWTPGRWIPRHPGYAWAPAHWVEDPAGRWRLIPGQWLPDPPPPP
jgi:hypothetical protein